MSFKLECDGKDCAVVVDVFDAAMLHGSIPGWSTLHLAPRQQEPEDLTIEATHRVGDGPTAKSRMKIPGALVMQHAPQLFVSRQYFLCPACTERLADLLRPDPSVERIAASLAGTPRPES